MKYPISLVLFLLTFPIWAQLTKSQVKMANNYFETIANYPRYIKALNKEISELKLEADNLSVALQTSDTIAINGLIVAIDEYEQRTAVPDSINTNLNNINEYVQSYFSIIPNGFGVYQALKGTTETIGGVFGVGGLIGTLLPNREPGLSSKKKKKVQDHILTSESKVLNNLQDLQEFLSGYYLPYLDELGQHASQDFQVLLKNIQVQNAPMDYFNNHNRLVTRYFQKLIFAKGLTKQLIKSIDTFRVAEKELTSRLTEKQKVELANTHFTQLVSEISKINATTIELQAINLH